MKVVLAVVAVALVVIGFANFFGVLSGAPGGPPPASVFITHPLAMLGMAYLLFAVVFPTFIGRRSPQADERLAEVRASGAELVAERPGGRIGMFQASAGLLAVSVYPGGIVIKPL